MAAESQEKRFPFDPATMNIKVFPLIALLLAACGGGSESPPGAAGTPPAAPDPVAEFTRSVQGLALEDFYRESFRQLLGRSPEAVVQLAPGAGFETDVASLDDLSDQYQRDTLAMFQVALDVLHSYERSDLDRDALLDYDVYAWYLEDNAAKLEFIHYGFPATFGIFGVPRSTELFFTDIHPLETPGDAEDYILRLARVSTKFSQLEDHILRQRSEEGIVEPRVTLGIALSEVRAKAALAAENHPYYTAFTEGIESIPALDAAQRANLSERALEAVRSMVIPAYGQLADTLNALVADAPAVIGVAQYRQGDEYYRYVLAHHTTTELEPSEIHALGLAELDRVHAEMRQRFDALGYPEDESLEALYRRVASDGGIVPAPDVLPTYEGLIALAEAGMNQAFDVFPSAPVRVLPDPNGGFYIGPSFDGSRPGAFYAGTAFAQPYFAMPSLAFHEAVPGHHTQIAIAMDQPLPVFRKIVRSTAFVEGWALYAERLAYELGWYENDIYGDLGRLQYEALRAARLVIDTGIHSMGWSFDEAVAFNQAAVGWSRSASQAAVARYSVLPGQATAYMVGMLTILDERQRAMNALGDEFDLVAFHRALLTSGGVPLYLLDEVVDRYIADITGMR